MRLKDDIDYNIPRKIRELQSIVTYVILILIITYQEKLGNYNRTTLFAPAEEIITYQEKLGNYNLKMWEDDEGVIITYQEKLGNYNRCERSLCPV